MSSDQYMNETIAEWVGFEERFTSGNLSYWWELGGYPFAKCPDFMNSETDCFRFIIPKLREKGYGVDITVGRAGAFANIWDLDQKHDANSMPVMAIGVDTNVSSAICMAAFELINTRTQILIRGVGYAVRFKRKVEGKNPKGPI